jgi:hypothetical protein
MEFLLPIQKQKNGKAKDLFCVNCLTHERHFTGGHSWAPDLCPCGCEDVIVWYKMNSLQKLRAQFIYYNNEKQRI